MLQIKVCLGCVVKEVLTHMERGKGPRGRPQKRRMDSVKELLGDIGMDWEQEYVMEGNSFGDQNLNGS